MAVDFTQVDGRQYINPINHVNHNNRTRHRWLPS